MQSKYASRRSRRVNRALAVLGSTASFVATAQTPPAETTPPSPDSTVLAPVRATAQQTDTYTVKETAAAAKLALTPRETPQSVTVMTRERLDDQKLQTLREVLDNTPGIYSTQYDTERVVFFSRGFQVDTLMYDGVPAMPSLGIQSLNDFIDSAPYERIEIVRGATGLMTGAGNPAASINLVRKHADSRTPTMSVDLTIGSWSDRRIDLDGSTPLNSDGSVRFRGVAAYEEQKSYQNLYEKQSYVLYGVVDADLSARTRLSLGYDFIDSQPNSPTWGSFPMVFSDGSLTNWDRSITTSTDWASWNRQVQTFFGELQHEFDNGWKARGTLSHRRFKEETKLFYIDAFTDTYTYIDQGVPVTVPATFLDPVTGLGGVPYAYRSQNRTLENSLDVYASGPFELAGRKHEVVVGYNATRSKNTGTEQAADPATMSAIGNFFQWNGSYAEPEWGDATLSSSVKTEQDAIYTVARFSLADSWKLIGGARFARWSIDSYDVYGAPQNTQYDYKKVIPYAGLIWDFAPQFSLFTSYTGIFKPQDARDINGNFLDPIEGKSIELGIKGEHFDRQLNTSFTVFDTRQDNVATQAIQADGTPYPDFPTNQGGGQRSVGADGTKTRGFEAEASGRLARNWRGAIGLTHYTVQDAAGEDIRTFAPQTMVRLFTTWDPKVWVEGLTLGAGVNWQSGTRTTIHAPNGEIEFNQKAYTLVSLMARYQFSPMVAVQFNANNVTDKKYYVLDEFDNTSYGAPANYTLSLRLSY
jgi:outer membrane receptor for ferric coprogen and ferric-rhodotorulic acid